MLVINRKLKKCHSLCNYKSRTVLCLVLQGQVQTLADKKGLSYDDAKAEFLANFHPSKEAVGIEQVPAYML